jgi:dTDP-glucose pyrophosphorylase
MKIIITMAGQGSRFKETGIKCPKHEIVARDKTLFEWSVESLKDFFEDSQFIFITRDCDINKLMLLCVKMGIRDFKFKELEAPTKGQAQTVLAADEFFGSDDEFIIYNIDTVLTGTIDRGMFTHEGHIVCFEPEGDHWSFVVPEPCEPSKIWKVVEKQRVSQYATVGLYYFKHFSTYRLLFSTWGRKVLEDYGEFYVAPMYQHLINSWRMSVTWNIVPNEEVICLGTPKEVEAFDPDYLSKNLDR